MITETVVYGRREPGSADAPLLSAPVDLSVRSNRVREAGEFNPALFQAISDGLGPDYCPQIPTYVRECNILLTRAYGAHKPGRARFERYGETYEFRRKDENNFVVVRLDKDPEP